MSTTRVHIFASSGLFTIKAFIPKKYKKDKRRKKAYVDGVAEGVSLTLSALGYTEDTL